VKTLSDIKQDMSDLYDSVRSGETDMKMADTLTNIAGKFVKADAMEFVRTVYLAKQATAIPDRTTIDVEDIK